MRQKRNMKNARNKPVKHKHSKALSINSVWRIIKKGLTALVSCFNQCVHPRLWVKRIALEYRRQCGSIDLLCSGLSIFNLVMFTTTEDFERMLDHHKRINNFKVY